MFRSPFRVVLSCPRIPRSHETVLVRGYKIEQPFSAYVCTIVSRLVGVVRSISCHGTAVRIGTMKNRRCPYGRGSCPSEDSPTATLTIKTALWVTFRCCKIDEGKNSRSKKISDGPSICFDKIVLSSALDWWAEHLCVVYFRLMGRVQG